MAETYFSKGKSCAVRKARAEVKDEQCQAELLEQTTQVVEE